jgi:DNA helicase-2/ATP-dependent DNA helicase PcrA
MVELQAYLQAVRRAHEGTLPLDDDQLEAVRYGYDIPLWMIAGPGTGKTHTLVWLVLKRMLVDDVPPHRVFLTTFTRKAAAELQSRILEAQRDLVEAGLNAAAEIDVTQMYLGTLHGLCSEILRDERYEPTLRARVLADQRAQEFFVRRTRNPLLDVQDVAFWDRFQLANYWGNQPSVPSMANRAENACTLLNRITENGVDLDAMRASGDPHFEILADAHEQYQADLAEHLRVDQAHLQQHFLDFLDTPHGERWLGDGFTVLVDEYQDTNPIQEEVYFALTGNNDLTVVGDDDQSLYRFRGATVESLIDFDEACQHYLGVNPHPVYLQNNRRSHPGIVDWVNRFIEHHPAMQDPNPDIRVRAPGKPELQAASDIDGDYPAVMTIAEDDDDEDEAARKMVDAIHDLMNEGLITDYSQVALLTFSTKETNWAIQEFADALNDAGIPFHNPRNKAAQQDEVLLALLGGLVYILDQDYRYSSPWTYNGNTFRLPRRLRRYIDQARDTFEAWIDTGQYPDLEQYADASVQALRDTEIDPDNPYLQRAGGRRTSISDIMFKLVAFEPFAQALQHEVHGERLKAVSQILAEFESLYNDGELQLEENDRGETQIEKWTLYNFYAVFVEGYHDGLDDPEDDEVGVQPGTVNVMTIHQSKGLQFEVVFVLKPGNQPFLGASHALEDELAPFIDRPTLPDQRRPRQARVAEDVVRLFFVAYSRAKRLLVLAGTELNSWGQVLGRDEDGNTLTDRDRLEELGVHFL